MLHRIKKFLRDQAGLPPIALLMGAGCIAHLLLNAVLRKPVTSAWGLLAPLALGLSLESIEIWVQYRDVGLLAQGGAGVLGIILRHSLDLLKVMLIPLSLVALGMFTTR